MAFSPELETLLKILKLQGFLKKDLSVRRALKSVGLEWRNYFKYAQQLYMDPELPSITTQGGSIRDHSILGIDLDQLRFVLNEVVKLRGPRYTKEAATRRRQDKEKRVREEMAGTSTAPGNDIDIRGLNAAH